MCGRFGIYEEPGKYKNQLPFSIRNGLSDFAPNYNATPSQMLPALYRPDDDLPVLETLRWGLVPHWAKDQKIGNKLFNARSETAHEKPSFRDAFVKRRALIPVNGWYEWLRQGKQKQPYWHTRKDDKLMWLAGLWESWTDKTSGELVRSFSILTQQSYGEFAKIHNRMPVIMRPDDYELWLSYDLTDKAAISQLINTQPQITIDIYRVSPAMNKPQLNDVSCIRCID